MIRVLFGAVTAAFLLIANSNAGPFLLPERTLATCGGGKIEHVVATVTEGDKSLIFVKAATGASVESDQKIVPIAELQNRGLVDDQIRAGTHTIIARAASCIGTKDCSSLYCNSGKCIFDDETKYCACK
jgi:hypothetical protein